MFKTIAKNTKEQIVEKKSKFIASAFYVESVWQAEEIMESIRKQYHDARHNCFAYRIIDENSIVEKQSDDGEPARNCGGAYA